MSSFESRTVEGKVLVEPVTGRIVEIDLLSSNGKKDRSFNFWYHFNKRIEAPLSQVGPFQSLITQNKEVA